MTFIVDDRGIPRCARSSWAFCLDPSHEFAATMIDGFGDTVSTSFVVGDYQAIGDHHLGAAGGAAIAAVAETKSLVWGAPYFLEKRIALVFDGMSVPGDPGRTGPFFVVKDTRAIRSSALASPGAKSVSNQQISPPEHYQQQPGSSCVSASANLHLVGRRIQLPAGDLQ